MKRVYDYIIVGAGPAGCAAATQAGTYGLSVLVIDEQQIPGGQIYRTLERTDVVSLHQVHCPEIDITGPSAARGIWYLHDYVVNPGEESGGMPGRSILQGAGFYDDRYVKVDGEWKIQHTGYERTFELITPYEPGAGVALRSRWNP